MINTSEIIGYIIATAVTTIGGYIAAQFKKMREDKNSFYNKQAEAVDKNNTWVEQQIGEANYNSAKQSIVDCVYKIEQLGKEMLWDGLTKHSKVSEWASKNTGLSEAQIFDIIKSTVGMINSKQSAVPEVAKVAS